MSEAAASETARQVIRAIQSSPDAEARWQAIQDNLGRMPPNALADLIVDLTRALASDHGPMVTDEVMNVFDLWHRRALVAAAHANNPADPVLTEEQWNALPEEWFGVEFPGVRHRFRPA